MLLLLKFLQHECLQNQCQPRKRILKHTLEKYFYAAIN